MGLPRVPCIPLCTGAAGEMAVDGLPLLLQISFCLCAGKQSAVPARTADGKGQDVAPHRGAGHYPVLTAVPALGRVMELNRTWKK